MVLTGHLLIIIDYKLNPTQVLASFIQIQMLIHSYAIRCDKHPSMIVKVF